MTEGQAAASGHKQDDFSLQIIPFANNKTTKHLAAV